MPEATNADNTVHKKSAHCGDEKPVHCSALPAGPDSNKVNAGPRTRLCNDVRSSLSR